ncbi:MAG: PQQ-binding-like beta-propeller repeat protein, partial [Anaerolineales bacterium]
MLKRLFIAVFVLGLVMALTGTALASNDGPNDAQVKQLWKGSTPPLNFDRARFATPNSHLQISQKLTTNERTVDQWNARTQQVFSPDTAACYTYFDLIDWANFAGSVSYFDMYGGSGFAAAVRYDIPKHHYATITGMEFWLSESSANSGGCSIEVGVWSDVAGLPGTLIFADTIAAADLPHPVAWSGDYVSHTFSSPVVVSDAEAFHISWGPTDDSPVDDYVECLFTRANSSQPDYQVTPFTSEFLYPDGGGWFKNADLWSSGDADNLQDVSYCVAFSDCYTQDPIPDPGYIWSGWWLPDDSYTDCPLVGYAQRFVSEGPDTLKQVRIFHKDDGGVLYPETGTNGMIVRIWPDDGTGNIDASGGPLAERIITGTRADLFPQGQTYGGTNWVYADFSADNLVLIGPWHVSVEPTSTDPAAGQFNFYMSYEYPGDDAYYSDGTGGSVKFTCDGEWHRQSESSYWQTDMDWLDEMSFWVRPELCRDEFYECQEQATFNGTINAGWGLPCCAAQRVSGQPVNKVSSVWVLPFFDDAYGLDPANNGQPDLVVTLYSVTPTGPGAEIYSVTVPYGDYVPTGWNEVVIPDVVTYGDFYAGYSFDDTNDPGSYFDFPVNSNDGSEVNGGMYYYSSNSAAWVHFSDVSGDTDNDLGMYVDFCSIPVEERPCTPDDWVTLQHDFQRTGASGVAVGDAQCRLGLNWSYQHPTLSGANMGPVIYNGLMVTPFRGTNTEYKAFDLYSKAEQWTVTYPAGTNTRCVPTVAYIAALDKDVVFVAGGDNDQLVEALDLADGSVLWSIAGGDLPSLTTSDLVTYGNFILLNDGTDDVLYFATDNGKIFAVNAADGTMYWAAPYQFGSGYLINRTGATDGDSLLFYGLQGSFGNGDVICVRALDGTLKWQLSTDGLKGNEAWGGGIQLEGFRAGIAYDAGEGVIFTTSTVVGPYPAAGTLYRINALSGITEEVAPCNGAGYMTTPLIDQNAIYQSTYPTWVGPLNGQFQSFRKDDLSLLYSILWSESYPANVYSAAEIFLSCEPNGRADLAFMFDVAGFLRVIDVDQGVELYNRRISAGNGAGGAIAMDTAGESHVVVQTSAGGIMDLMASPDPLARMEIVSPDNKQPVPFGSDPNYVVTFPDVFKNTGCIDLNCTIDISDTSNGMRTIPLKAVSSDLNNNAMAIADRLTTSSKMLTRPFDAEAVEAAAAEPVSAKLVNRAALADMSWIVTPTILTTTAPGATEDIAVTVNQGMVGRGVFPFYAWFTSMNDADYWYDQLNDPPYPEVRLVFAGGCLNDTTTLWFGDPAYNKAVIFNSGRMSTPGDGAQTWGEDENNYMFGGFFIFGITERRLAWNSENWYSDSEGEWLSWLPDLYEGECKPALTSNVTLGSASADGVTYTAIKGDAIQFNSIDSVQNFWDGTAWDITLYDNAPYDNDSTMGLSIHTKAFGAHTFGSSVDLLGNASVEIMTFTERNGRALPGWKMGAYIDFDTYSFSSGGVGDTAVGNRDISAAWVYDFGHPTATQPITGQVKLPFNFCANQEDPWYVEPLKSAYAIDGDQAMYNNTEGIVFFDSAYYYMSLPPGNYGHDVSAVEFDQAAFFTLAERDIEPNETFEFAVANFYVEDNGYGNGDVTRLAHQL